MCATLELRAVRRVTRRSIFGDPFQHSAVHFRRAAAACPAPATQSRSRLDCSSNLVEFGSVPLDERVRPGIPDTPVAIPGTSTRKGPYPAHDDGRHPPGCCFAHTRAGSGLLDLVLSA